MPGCRINTPADPLSAASPAPLAEAVEPAGEAVPGAAPAKAARELAKDKAQDSSVPKGSKGGK